MKDPQAAAHRMAITFTLDQTRYNPYASGGKSFNELIQSVINDHMRTAIGHGPGSYAKGVGLVCLQRGVNSNREASEVGLTLRLVDPWPS